MKNNLRRCFLISVFLSFVGCTKYDGPGIKIDMDIEPETIKTARDAHDNHNKCRILQSSL